MMLYWRETLCMHTDRQVDDDVINITTLGYLSVCLSLSLFSPPSLLF